MESLWGSAMRSFGTLNRDLNTDVLIIGGGMCGILCAHFLQKVDIDYVLVEADRICDGITKGTTAKITSQHGLIYQKLVNQYGWEKAKQYLQANEEARKQFDVLCNAIDCDYEYRDSFVFSRNNREKLAQEAAVLKQLGYDAEVCGNTRLPFPVAGAVRFAKQAQFNPLKFVSEISAGLNIYEHTRVQELVGTKALTNGGTIQAKKVIVATHFPFINKHGLYFLKLYQHRSYVIALKNAPLPDGMYVDEAKKGLSFRTYRDTLLIGGGSHRTGKNGGGWQELRVFAGQYFPQAEEVCHWATQDCMSLDGIPYIGAYSKNTEGLYVATGFNKWGMTSSMVAAMLISDLVQGKGHACSSVFSPSRSMLHPQLAVNAWEATVSILTPTQKRCPHLGCALKWNPIERTWDCPCHGSRFTESGKLLDNPATGDLK